MNVSLTPELERLVDDKVKSGLYQTASEVVRHAKAPGRESWWRFGGGFGSRRVHDGPVRAKNP
jgi:hypothetical protein